MHAVARFALRLPILTVRTAFAVTATIALLPVTLPIARVSYRTTRRAIPLEDKAGMEYLRALGILLSTLGTTLPIQSLRGARWDWEEAIGDLRRSKTKSFS